MAAYVQNLLSYHANKLNFDFHSVGVSVLREIRGCALALGAHATSIKQQIALRLAMLRSFCTYGNVALAGLWATLALHEVPARAPRDVARAIEPATLTVEDHWRRATGILTAALSSFQRIKHLQATAARQLDSADYALTQLLHDLRPAMALPADVSGLRAILAEAERTAPERYRQALAA